MRTIKALLNALVLAALTTAWAWAGVVVQFDHPQQTANPGGTLQFFGVIENTGPDIVYLNGDSLTLDVASLTTTDQFYANVPVSLDADTSSGDIELFDVTVSNPLLDPAGTYPGSYVLVGGVDSNAGDNLASANFEVTTAPEPSSGFLLAVALASILIVGHRRDPGFYRHRSSVL
jgi:hypothetical protein